MALELLVSPPGTGKTSYCIEWFKKGILKTKGGIDSRSFFVLPNREHAERIQALVLKKGVDGLFNAHILTIHDLAARLAGVFAVKRPTDAVRQSILREILEDERLSFKTIGEVRGFSGFRRLLLDTIKEFKSSLLNVREFERRAGPLLADPAFRNRWGDFSILLKNYDLRLKALGLKEPEEDIQTLVGRKSPAERFNADLVIFDGFYHFNRAQGLLLRAVSRVSKHTVVTLTLPESGEQRTLFEHPERTRVFLRAAGFREPKGLFRKNYRTQDPALRHLEKNIFLSAPRVRNDTADSVVFLAAPSARAEVEMIAREIKRIYREHTLHFSDICVILREIGAYEKILRSVFAELGVPVHIHERKKLIESGFAMTLFRFLNLPLEGWRREDLFFVLKSSYFPFTGDTGELMSLESFVFANNVLGGRPLWAALADDARVPAAAQEALRWVLDAESGLLSSGGIRGFSGRLLSFLGKLRCSEKDELDKQTLKAVESILQSARMFHEGTGRPPFSPAAFIREFQGNLETALFSSRPEGKNRVQVYDVVMALPKEYKVVFVSGLAEKTFPKAGAEDPLFKDAERRVINRRGVVLEERLGRLAGERYFFYMALTRARERLYLTTPLHDGGGRPSLPSFFTEEVRRCFAGVRELKKDLREFLPEPEEWSTENDVRRGLAEKFFQTPAGIDIPTGMLPVLNERLKDDQFKALWEMGSADKTARIGHAEAKRFFESMKIFSATRLETYATCAFKFFAGKVLRLAEPLEGRQYLEMGTALHKTLEGFYKGLSAAERADPLFWQNEDRIRPALERSLREALAENPFGNHPLYRQRLYLERMRRTIGSFYERERELSRDRNLVPSHFELDFGRKGSALGSLKIDDGSGGEICIEGQIDRVDTVRGSSKMLVIDYKKSGSNKDLRARLEKGLELQLPIYLMAVRQLLAGDPIGGELRLLEESKERGLYGESAREILGLGTRKKVYSEQEFQNLLSESERQIREVVSRLKGADIRVDSKSCEHCRFDDVCRFDKWRQVYSEDEDE